MKAGEVLTSGTSVNHHLEEKNSREAKNKDSRPNAGNIDKNEYTKLKGKNKQLGLQKENISSSVSLMKMLRVGQWVEVEFLTKATKHFFRGIIISCKNELFIQ